MPKIVPVSFRRLVKIFEALGFVLSRTHGDHLIYTKVGIVRPLVIPRYEQIPVFVIKNLLRTAGVSREEYFELLR